MFLFDISGDGVIYAVWADSREHNDSRIDSSRFNIYLSRSTDDGLSWSPNMRINDSDQVFNRNYWTEVSVVTQGGTDEVIVTWTKYRNTAVTDVSHSENNTPSVFRLNQNYPNPFNPSTKVSFDIGKSSFVNLKVYDVLGNEVAALVNEEKPAGRYEVEFNGAGLTSGVYIFRIKAGSYVDVKKALLIK